MPLRLERVTRDRCAAWDNFLQIYLHELSAFTSKPVDDEGRFCYDLREACLGDGPVEAWHIVIKGRLAGFLVIRTAEDGVREVLDYFLLNSYRGLGLGREAALCLFSMWPGRWRAHALEASPTARGFWRRVLRSILSRRFRSYQDARTGTIIFEFEVQEFEVQPAEAAVVPGA